MRKWYPKTPWQGVDTENEATPQHSATVENPQCFNVNDITSIVRFLENRSFAKNVQPFLQANALGSLAKDFEIQILSIVHFLNDEELTACMNKLSQLGKFLQTYRDRKCGAAPSVLNCCETSIKIYKDINSWHYLDQHEHIEELLVKYLHLNEVQDCADIAIYPRHLSVSTLKEMKTTNLNYHIKIIACISTYDKDVKTTLYADTSDNHVCLQFAGPAKVYCLVCNTECDIQLKHVFNSVHKRRLQYMLKSIHLLSYHDFWSMLAPKYQVHQVHFGCEGFGTDSANFCRLCCIAVDYKATLTHIMSEPHKLVFERGISKKLDDLHFLKRRMLLYQQPTSSVNYVFNMRYNEEVQNTLYVNEADCVNNIDRATLQLREADKGYCLLCNECVTKLASQIHCASDRHQSHVLNTEKIAALISYHNYWMSEKPIFQIHQLHFTPWSTAQLTCRRCSAIVAYDNIITHLFTPTHHSSLLKFSKSKGANWNFRDYIHDIYPKEVSLLEAAPTQPTPLLVVDALHRTLQRYHPNIIGVIYPQELVAIVAKIDGIGVGVQSKSPNCICCLICSKVFGPQLYVQHFSGKPHATKCSPSSPELMALLDYHNFWISKPLKIQVHQVFFYPLNQSHLYCIPCKIIVKFKKTLTHITDQHHCSNLLKFIQTSAANWYLSNICLPVCDNTLKQPKELASLLDYDPAVREVLYGQETADPIVGKRELVMYSVQCRGPTSWYCLSCEVSMTSETNVKTHNAGRKHANKKNTTESDVYTYHNFWMKLPLHYQVHQLFFSSRGICGICNKHVDYKEVKNHLLKHRSVLYYSYKELTKKYNLGNMWHLIYEELEEDAFKFSFKITYGKCVDFLVYHQTPITEVNTKDTIEEYMIQRRKRSLMYCLVCWKEVHFGAILEHTANTEHKNNLKNNEKNMETLLNTEREMAKINRL